MIVCLLGKSPSKEMINRDNYLGEFHFWHEAIATWWSTNYGFWHSYNIWSSMAFGYKNIAKIQIWSYMVVYTKYIVNASLTLLKLYLGHILIIPQLYSNHISTISYCILVTSYHISIEFLSILLYFGCIGCKYNFFSYHIVSYPYT